MKYVFIDRSEGERERGIDWGVVVGQTLLKGREMQEEGSVS